MYGYILVNITLSNMQMHYRIPQLFQCSYDTVIQVSHTKMLTFMSQQWRNQTYKILGYFMAKDTEHLLITINYKIQIYVGLGLNIILEMIILNLWVLNSPPPAQVSCAPQLHQRSYLKLNENISYYERIHYDFFVLMLAA